MTDIIAQLAELIVKDNALLFVGPDLGGREDRASLVQEIAHALAVRLDYTKPDRSLAAVARDFQALQGRNALISALREEVARSQGQPGPIHQLIADAVLPTTKVITTRFDRTLEQAFDQFRKPYVLIVRDTDVSFFDESKLTLIKIQGDIDQPDSLVVTEDDIEDFIGNLPTLSDVVRAFFATKTLIFLGYDLENPQFKRLFRQVTRNLSVYRRTAYAIQVQDLDPADRRYWEGQGVDIRTQDPMRFLEELAAAVKEWVQRPAQTDTNPLQKLTQRALPPHPYKGLESFIAQDAPIFVGRDLEIRRFTNRVLANRLTILYGESGSGKSSLLQAGLAPALLDRRALLAVAKPDAAMPLIDLLGESLGRVAHAAGLTVNLAGVDLADAVRAVQHLLDGPVVLAVDQAEQFFLVYDDGSRQAVVTQLRHLLTDRSLDLRMVLVIREDFLGRLQPLEQFLPNLMDARFRLDILGQEAAREAMEEPARLFGATWEPALVSRLLQDLYDRENRGISPPQLQITCLRLYDEAIARQGGGKPTLDLALFAALGSTAAILASLLNQSVAELPPTRQSAARTLLGSLVTSSGAKQRLGLADLARSAQVDVTEAGQVLDVLVSRSLVRQIVQPPPADSPDQGQLLSYELTHDYLITPIIAWLGDDFWAAQKAREILRQAVPEWDSRMRLLPPEDLDLATRQVAHLQLSQTETQLLYASAVAYAQHIHVWQPKVADAIRRDLLTNLCHHPEGAARRHAATRLALFDDAPVADLLADLVLTDPELDVQASAALALAGLAARAPDAGAVGVDALARAALTGGEGADRALAALATIRDLTPSVQALLPAELAQSVRRRVWGMRWERGREWVILRLVRGLQGGFWGLGLGIGLFLGLNRLIADGFTLDLLAQRFDSILFAISSGIPVMGVMGAVAVGVTGGVGALLVSLEDGPNPRRAWAVQSGVGGITLALLWLLFAFVFPGQTVALRALAAGGLIGLGLFGAATAPIPLPEPMRLALVGVVGAAVLGLAYGLGLIFAARILWVIWMGAVSGLGVAWGLPPLRSSRAVAQP